MLAASHAIIGASLAKIIPNPLIALPLNLVMHFAGDIFPHWDWHTRESNRSKLKVIIISLADAIVGYVIGWLLFGKQVPFYYLLLMMFVAQLPDWAEAPYRIFDWHFPPFSWVKKLQSRLHHKLDLPWGLIWQIAAVAGFVFTAKL